MKRQRIQAACLLALMAWGCKHPDDGPRPYVFPAYPVQNLPPARHDGQPERPPLLEPPLQPPHPLPVPNSNTAPR